MSVKLKNLLFNMRRETGTEAETATETGTGCFNRRLFKSKSKPSRSIGCRKDLTLLDMLTVHESDSRAVKQLNSRTVLTSVANDVEAAAAAADAAAPSAVRAISQLTNSH